MSWMTFAQMKNALARNTASGVCPSDSRVMDRSNQSVQRLLTRGNWVYTVSKISLCYSDSCVVLPEGYDHIIGYNAKDVVGAPRTLYYEVSDVGPGEIRACNKNSSDSGCGCGTKTSSLEIAVDRGNSPLVREICGHKYIKVYCDVAEAADARILIQGIDINGNEVMSFVDGQWIFGEYISLTNVSPQTSSTIFSKVTAIIKPITNGFVRIYQVDENDASIQSLSAILSPTLQVPAFRRYMIPGIPCANRGEPVRLNIIAKKAFVPITNDNDIPLIQNLTALIMMNKSNEFIEQDNITLATQYEGYAVEELNKQLYEHSQGSRPILNVQWTESPGSIYQPI